MDHSATPYVNEPLGTVKPPPRFVGRRRKTRSWPCPRPSTFAILVVHELHDVTLQLSGSLLSESRFAVEDCAQAAIAEQPRRLVLELSALEDIDGEGVQGLLSACESARDAGVDPLFDSPSPAVRATLADSMAEDGIPIR